jgi:hypothetical protein
MPGTSADIQDERRTVAVNLECRCSERGREWSEVSSFLDRGTGSDHEMVVTGGTTPDRRLQVHVALARHVEIVPTRADERPGGRRQTPGTGGTLQPLGDARQRRRNSGRHESSSRHGVTDPAGESAAGALKLPAG